ncbi:MAG: iron-siderophore ABC transporter substrate-binding protein [Cyanobacteria bacterium J06626_18]
MSKSVHNMILVGTLVSLLVACQQTPTPVASEPTVPTRVVEHAMGTSAVPISPERVVVLDTAPLDTALALGIQPVGTVIYSEFPDYLKGKVSEITVVGEGNQPNLETILKLEPDLILGSKTGSAPGLYQQLSQIAPTVFTEGSGRENDWQENFQLYAEALGQSEQARQLLQSYQQRARQLQETLGQPQAIEVSVLIAHSDRIRSYTTGSFSGSVLQDIGFSRTAAQDVTQDYTLEISAEALDKLDGNYIFLIYSTFRPGGFTANDFIADPIWSQLTAVQQDRVCQVTGEVWAAGRSLLAANQILTDVKKCLGNFSE